jgi:hypothetical protein
LIFYATQLNIIRNTENFMDPKEVSNSIVEGDNKAAEEWTRKALEAGMDPVTIMNEGLILGMDIVGEKFQSREFFMPEMLVAARAMKASMGPGQAAVDRVSELLQPSGGVRHGAGRLARYRREPGGDDAGGRRLRCHTSGAGCNS